MNRKWIIGVAMVFLLIGYVYRVYTVNTSDAVKYATPTVLKYQSSEAVELRPGYYNIGYIDLSGYYINVTGARIQKMSDFLAAIGCDDSFYDAQGINRKYQYVYLVDATFWFDGDNDPLNNVVDLTSFKLVGDDYYCDFSFEVNSLAGVNPVLEGNSMFSIGSGKRIGLQMPFLVDSESVNGTSENYLLSHPPKLMVSQYPYEVYISLPAANS